LPVHSSAQWVSASTPARVEYGKETHIDASKDAKTPSAGALLLASVLVRKDEKLAGISNVLMAVASAARTHEEHVHRKAVAQVWEADVDAGIAVWCGQDPCVVDVACAPRAVFVDGADEERRTGPGRRGRSSLRAP
jgi:hypothetical protein